MSSLIEIFGTIIAIILFAPTMVILGLVCLDVWKK